MSEKPTSKNFVKPMSLVYQKVGYMNLLGMDVGFTDIRTML